MFGWSNQKNLQQTNKVNFGSGFILGAIMHEAKSLLPGSESVLMDYNDLHVAACRCGNMT